MLFLTIVSFPFLLYANLNFPHLFFSLKPANWEPKSASWEPKSAGMVYKPASMYLT
jgi:hypothetical protein